MLRSYALAGISIAAAALLAPPAYAVNDYFPTWYVGVRGAVSTLKGSDLGTYPLPDTDWDPGFNVGATVGVAMPRAFVEPLAGLRLEGEISRYWHHIDNARTDFFFPIMIQSDGEREFTVTSYMINAYYYFPFNMLLTPYVGGGIGRADVELANDPVAPSPGDNEDSVAAWQAMIGLSFQNHPDALTEWNLGYRYFTTDDPEFDDGFGGTTVLENTIHSLELGLHLRF